MGGFAIASDGDVPGAAVGEDVAGAAEVLVAVAVDGVESTRFDAAAAAAESAERLPAAWPGGPGC